MLARTATHQARRITRQSVRRGLATVEKGASPDSPIAGDGRHEVWREGIYDHDNEPKVGMTTSYNWKYCDFFEAQVFDDYR